MALSSMRSLSLQPAHYMRSRQLVMERAERVRQEFERHQDQEKAAAEEQARVAAEKATADETARTVN